MPYASPENISGLLGIWQYVNDASGQVFGIGMLVTTLVVLFWAMNSRFTASRSFVGAGFVTFIIGAFLRVNQLIADWVLLVFVMILIIGVIWLRMDQRSDI